MKLLPRYTWWSVVIGYLLKLKDVRTLLREELEELPDLYWKGMLSMQTNNDRASTGGERRGFDVIPMDRGKHLF